MKRVSDLTLELQEFYQEHGEMQVTVRVEPQGGRGHLRPIEADLALSLGALISSRSPAEPVCVVEL